MARSENHLYAGSQNRQHGQQSILAATLPEQVQAFAQRFAAQIIARQRPVPSLGAAAAAPARARPIKPAGTPAGTPATTPAPIHPSVEAGELARYQEVDLDSLDFVDPRSVGVEHAALSAMRQCGLEDKLSELGHVLV